MSIPVTPVSALVSIIVPTYNRAAFLPAALEAALAQTWTDLEVIVVDDGSTDNTREVAERIAARDPRLRYVHQINSKLPAALNTGHRAARGSYLTWTADDNLYEPEAIQVMLDYLRAHPEIGLVYCNMKQVDEEDRQFGVWEWPGPETLGDKNCVGGCFLYSRHVFETVGEFATDMFLAEDYEYWLRISRQFPLAHLQGVAPYRWRYHKGSLSSTREAEVTIQVAKARCRHVVPEAQRCRVLAQAYWDALWRYRAAAEWESAARCVRELLRLRPLYAPYWKAALAVWAARLQSVGKKSSAAPSGVRKAASGDPG